MTNAEILVNSLNDWVTPIIEKGFKNLANQNQITFLLSNLITPERLAKSIKEQLSIPLIHEQIAKFPDAIIPNLSLDIIDGMIATRVENGALELPMLGLRLTPDAFRNLKKICQTNFKNYSEQPETEKEETDNPQKDE